MMSCSGQKTPPIFIVGTPRSGTTLTASILGRHSRIFMPGETHFFGDIYSRRKELGDPRHSLSMVKIIERLSTLYSRHNEPLDQERIDRILFANREKVNQLRHSCNNYRDILSFFMEIQMKHEGKVRWGNNVPKDVFHIDEILSFYPDAKILICVRDVRDFIVSYKDRWRVIPPEHTDRVKRLYHPVVTSLLWKATVRQIEITKQKVLSENMMIIKYEDLVQRPVEVVTKICEVLGEKFEDGMLAVDSHNSSSVVHEKGIFTSSVGRWRDSLGEEEAFIAELVNRRELNKMEYTIESKRGHVLKVLGHFFSFPIALCRGLHATRHYRGKLIPYLARRIASLSNNGPHS